MDLIYKSMDQVIFIVYHFSAAGNKESETDRLDAAIAGFRAAALATGTKAAYTGLI